MQGGESIHILDGLMDPIVWAIGFLVAIPALFLAFRSLSHIVEEERVAFMAVLAAGIFVAQMLNFPVIGGTTGHLLGAALATVLVGVPGAMAVLAVVIIMQALFFGDGGITALGLNLLNMAVVAPVISGIVLRISKETRLRTSIFVASWCSLFVSATLVTVELSASFAFSGGTFGISPLFSIPAMLGYHAVIGVGEGIITVGVWSFISKVAPEVTKAGQSAVKEAVQ